jgi:hypothetical protein
MTCEAKLLPINASGADGVKKAVLRIRRANLNNIF